VSNPRSWVYAVPDEGDSPPPSGDRDGQVEKTEGINIQRIEPIQQQFSSDSAAIQQLPTEHEMLNCQKAEPVSNSGVIQPIHQIQPLEGGEGVCSGAEEMSQLTIDSKTESIIQQLRVTASEPAHIEKPAASTEPDYDELSFGDLVRYIGNNPDWQHYKRLTMVVEGLASKSAGSPDYDMITCRLPGGVTNDFLRNTLRRVFR
jgi:hypothetical protein